MLAVTKTDKAAAANKKMLTVSAITARRRRNASLAARRPYFMAAAEGSMASNVAIAVLFSGQKELGGDNRPVPQSTRFPRCCASQLTSGAFNNSSIDTPIFDP